MLQARQVLASLLAKWSSESPRLSTTFLGSLDTTEYFSLLDILLRDQKHEIRNKVRMHMYICKLVHTPQGLRALGVKLQTANDFSRLNLLSKPLLIRHLKTIVKEVC